MSLGHSGGRPLKDVGWVFPAYLLYPVAVQCSRDAVPIHSVEDSIYFVKGGKGFIKECGSTVISS